MEIKKCHAEKVKYKDKLLKIEKENESQTKKISETKIMLESNR